IAGLAEDDAIIALGDIVDRGPDSPGVLNFFRSARGSQDQKVRAVRSIMGNHERKHIRSARHEIKPALSQVLARAQFGDSYPAALAFMESLPLLMDLPEATLVHGSIEPGVLLEEQRATVLCGTTSGEMYLRAHYDRSWQELYDREKPLVVGHRDHLRNGQPMIFRDLIYCLDTSCVHGKALTGLLLPSFRIVAVPSRANYWSQLTYQHRKTVAPVPQKVRFTPATELQDWGEPANQALQALACAVNAEHQRILAELQEQPEYTALTPRQQALAYAGIVSRGPFKDLAPLLHLARRAALTPLTVQNYFKAPERVAKLLSFPFVFPPS
ncbi:MAG: metallophosphoesterase, partial [Anaerolineaceae bacterium]|nr:metallophosphoesterase [Anaerolineaceae bacterium]